MDEEAEELSVEEVEVCKRAAMRWGHANPSFDDVISELTPSYRTRTRNHKPSDIRHWRRLKEYALTLPRYFTGVGCPVCGNPVKSNTASTCSRECGSIFRSIRGRNHTSSAVTQEESLQIVQMYVELQLPDYRIGQTMGMGTGKVRRVLDRAGVKRRPKPVSQMPKCARAGCENRVKRRERKHCSQFCAGLNTATRKYEQK